MQIFFQGFQGRTGVLNVQPDFTVLDIKELYCHRECLRPEGEYGGPAGPPPPFTRLIWHGIQLEDQRTLGSYEISENDTIHVTGRLAGQRLFVTKDWEQLGGKPRYIPQSRAALGTGCQLKQWVSDTTGICTEKLTLKFKATPIAEDFEDWASLFGTDELAITIDACRADTAMHGNSGLVPAVAHHVETMCWKPEFADMTVTVGTDTFEGHRVIVSRLPFFAAALRSEFTEAQSANIVIRDVDPATFRILWRAIYTDNLEFVKSENDEDLLWRVLPVTHRFEFGALHDVVVHRLGEMVDQSLTPESVPSSLALARRYAAPQLQEQCLSFIREYGDKVLMTMVGQDWSTDVDTYRCIVQAATGKRQRCR